MKYLKICFVAALMAVCGVAEAVGPRFSSYPSTTTVSVSNPIPSPGETIQITAKVNASALGVYMVPTEALGGYVEFFANGASIGRVRIAQNNTPSVHYVSYLDQACYIAVGDTQFCTYWFFYGVQGIISINYQVPPSFTSSSITASFTGDSNFSKGSSSSAVVIRSIPTYGFIRGMGGKCLDAEASGIANGTAIQVWGCLAGASNQLWTVTAGQPYITGVQSSRVLDIANYATANGSGLQLWNALQSTNQSWKFTSSSISGIGDKVLDAVGAATGNGTKLQLYTNAKTSNQVWTFDPESGRIVGASGKCLDVEAGSTADGAAVQLWDCTNVPQQAFELGENGSIRGIGGKCLESADGSSANGSQIRMWTCNGGAHQSWRIIGEIRNPSTNRCLADPGRGAVDGAKTYIWDCTGDANQQWEYSSY